MPVDTFGPRHYGSHNDQCVQVYDLPMDLPMLHRGRLVRVRTYLRTFMLGSVAIVGYIPYAIVTHHPCFVS
jgi:hypothetical protein